MSATPMSTVLALESDDRRTGFLRAVVCDQLRASLVVADSAESAIAAISALIPDVVLVGPDFPPSEEIEVKDYLLSLQRSTVPEILRVPALSHNAPRRTGLLGALRRRAADISQDSAEKGDLQALAARITSALDRGRSARADGSTNVSAPQPPRGPRVTRKPDPTVRTVAGSSAPALTFQAPCSGTEVGKPPASPATPRGPAGAPREVADDDQNEWGFFDPSRCGYAALAATLDMLPEEVQENAGPGPADLLLQSRTVTEPVARSEPPAAVASTPVCAEPPPPARTGREVSTAARSDRKRHQPAPLALWAHFFRWEDGRSASHALLRYTEAMAGVAALLSGLNAPAQIAEVQYGSGCRVHRVRGLAWAASPGPATFEVASSEPDSPPVSRSALSESSPAW
jgi:hypothetical protein